MSRRDTLQDLKRTIVKLRHSKPTLLRLWKIPEPRHLRNYYIEIEWEFFKFSSIRLEGNLLEKDLTSTLHEAHFDFNDILLVEHKLRSNKDFVFVEYDQTLSEKKWHNKDNENLDPEDLTFLNLPLEDYVRRTWACGLSNLGNSCYMNASLQCLLHVEELQKYFLIGFHNQEINHRNVMGTKGWIAEKFGDLAYETWTSRSGRIQPYEIK